MAVLEGTSANDILLGGDLIQGSDFDDTLLGFAGDDILAGQRGLNILTGGEGADIFVIERTPGGSGSTDRTTITDFVLGEDQIGLGLGLTFSDLNIFTDQGSTFIRDTVTSQILGVLSNFNGTLTADSFITADSPALTGIPLIEGGTTVPETLPGGVRIIELADYGTEPFAEDSRTAYYLSSSLYTFLADQRETGQRFVAFDFLAPSAPNQNTPVGPLPHTHSNELELFYVVEGTYVFTEGQQTPEGGVIEQVEAGPGTLVYGPQGQVHGFRLREDTGPGRIFSITLPAGLDNFFETSGDIVENRFDPIAPINEVEVDRTAFWAEQRRDAVFIPSPVDTTRSIDGRPVPVFREDWPNLASPNISDESLPTFTGPFGEMRRTLISPEQAGAVTGQFAWKGTGALRFRNPDDPSQPLPLGTTNPFADSSVPILPGGTVDYSFISLDPETNTDFALLDTVSLPAGVTSEDVDLGFLNPNRVDAYEVIYTLSGELALKVNNEDPVTLPPLTYIEIPEGNTYSLANTNPDQQAEALTVRIFNAPPEQDFGNAPPAPPPPPPVDTEDDLLTPSPVATLINGDNGSNILLGDDLLTSRNFDDVINGEAGDDVLAGQRGLNILTGGLGADVFILERTPGGSGSTDRTVIADFTLGEDRIGLAPDLSFDLLNIFTEDENTLIEDTVTGQTIGILANFSNSLDASNFVSATDFLSADQLIQGGQDVPETITTAAEETVRIIELSDYGADPFAEDSRVAYYLSSSLYTFLADQRETGQRFVAFDFLAPPASSEGQRVGPLPHTHSNEIELFYVVDGEYIFTEGQQTPEGGVIEEVEADPGTLVYGPQGRVHGFRLKENTGTGRIFSFTLPAGLDNFFVTAGDVVENRFDPIAPVNPVEIDRTAFWAEQRGDALFLPSPVDTTRSMDGRPVPVFREDWPDLAAPNIEDDTLPTSTGIFGETRRTLVSPEQVGAVTGQFAWKGAGALRFRNPDDPSQPLPPGTTNPFSDPTVPILPGGTVDYSFVSLDPGTNTDFAVSDTVALALEPNQTLDVGLPETVVLDPQTGFTISTNPNRVDIYQVLYTLEGELSLKIEDQDPLSIPPLTYIEIPEGVTYSLANTHLDQTVSALSIRAFNAPVDLPPPDPVLIFGSPENDIEIAITPQPQNAPVLVFAGAGDDLVEGSAEPSVALDRVYGGSGVDEILAGTNDRAFGSQGNDILEGSQSVGTRLYGGGGDDEIFAGEDSRVFGGSGNDFLDATPGNGKNRLYGGVGDDFLKAGSNDVLKGDEGNDTLVAGRGGAVLHGGEGIDTFVLTEAELPDPTLPTNVIADFDPETEVLTVGLSGLTFDLLNLVQDGEDVIINVSDVPIATLLGFNVADLSEDDFDLTTGTGGTGGDGSGAPSPTLLEPATIIAEPEGNENIIGSLGDDSFYGNLSGSNTFDGSSGDDVLYAGVGGDTLNGNSGEDALIASVGNDTLTGGSDDDQFIFNIALMTNVEGENVAIGGYGGEDVITDYELEAGAGDQIILKNLDVNTRVDVLNNPAGNAFIILSNLFIDPETGQVSDNLQQPERPVIDFTTGEIVALPGNTFQTITVEGVTAQDLMLQAQIEVNGIEVNATTQGVIQSFGSYNYIVGGINTNFPSRPQGNAGNLVLGDPLFGTVPDVPLENNLVRGDFVTDEEIATVLQKMTSAFPDGITIPGTDADLTEEVRAELEAQKIIGEIPAPLLPQNAFSFAFNDQGEVDLSRFTTTADSATVNDDTIIGGPGNDFLIGGPGNDAIIGGFGTDIIWAGVGQDLIIGREGTDHIIFNSILDIRDRDIPAQDQASNAYADARLGYIRFEEPYGDPLTFTDPLTGEEVENPFSTRTGADIIWVNAEAFNRGINEGDPEAADIGFLKPGTIITGDGSGPAATQNGQLRVTTETVPTSNGPAENDMQPTFIYNPTSARLFFDRDGTGSGFFDFWMADMGTGLLESDYPAGTPDAAPDLIIAIY